MKKWIIVYTLGGDPLLQTIDASDAVQAIYVSGLPFESIISVSGVILNS